MRLRPALQPFKAQQMTQRKMVEALNSAGTRTAQGGQWSLMQLQRVLARLS